MSRHRVVLSCGSILYPDDVACRALLRAEAPMSAGRQAPDQGDWRRPADARIRTTARRPTIHTANPLWRPRNSGEPDRAADIIHAVRLYWFRAERLREIEGRCTDLVSRNLGEHSRAVVLSNLAEAQIATSSPQSALAQSLAGLDSARRCGARDLEMCGYSQLGRIFSQTGRPDASRAAFADALVLAREDGDEREVLTALGNLANNEMMDARPAAALDLFDKAEAIARRIGDRFGLAMIMTNAVYIRGIEDPASVDRLAEASSVFAELGPSPFLAWATLCRIAALVVSGQDVLARSETYDVLPPVEEVGTWGERAQVADVAAMIIARSGRHAEAAGLIGRSDRIRSNADSVVNEASDPLLHGVANEVQRQLGPSRFERLRREGAEAAPATLIPFVRGLFGPGAVVPQTTVGRYGLLSRREEEILRLVGRGMTDPEIANELGISAKTASVHVSNIKPKLGHESRIDVAVAGRSAPLIE